MRRLLALTLLVPFALAVPAATAQDQVPPPCAYWVHGCDFPEYVYDFCDRNTTVDCRPQIAWPPIG